jgi:hypothetical protein
VKDLVNSQVNKRGQINKCVEVWRFINDLRSSSRAASAAAGGGDHTKIPDLSFGRQKP